MQNAAMSLIRYLVSAVVLLVAAGPLTAQAPNGIDSPSFRLMAFGDVDYVVTDRDIPAGFQIGQLVGHLNAGLTDKLAFFGEFSVTDGGDGFGVTAERVILRYDFSDNVKVSLGRYHTPVGYWNAAFHHGAWLQTTADRPRMVQFGGRFIPVHFLGLLIEGNVPSGPLGLSYGLGIGNGRQDDIAQPGNAGDLNDTRAIVATLRSQPLQPFGLEVGLSAYLDRAQSPTGMRVDERILAAHVVWRRMPEIMAEYARVRHDPAAGAITTNHAYYLQVGLPLSGMASDFTPYTRAERITIAEGDALFSGLGLEYEGVIVGLRYDFAPFAALKAEYRNASFAGGERMHSMVLQADFVLADFGIGDGS